MQLADRRADFKRLAELRLREAKVLLAKRYYAGAYYLAGYAVECALKACIAQRTRRYDFPDRKRGQDSHTHNLSQLVGVAQLQLALNNELSSNSIST
jgi:HEPN domain-containing protein